MKETNRKWEGDQQEVGRKWTYNLLGACPKGSEITQAGDTKACATAKKGWTEIEAPRGRGAPLLEDMPAELEQRQ